MAKGAELEVENMKLLEERIKAPCIWGRVPCGIRFEDLQDTRYDSAVQFLKKHYLPEEITYRSLKMVDDKEGVEEFANNAKIWLKDKMSIAAVKEGTDKLVGVLIMRIQEKRIAKEMLKSANGLCKSATIPALAGIFTTARAQQIAQELGFKKYNELYYTRYLINEKVVFWDAGLGNYGAALMAFRIPGVEEVAEVGPQISSRFSIRGEEENDEDNA